MKKEGRPNHIKRNITLALLLALLCVGAVELAACRYFEPEIYETIVSPVRYAATVVVDTGKAGLNAAARFCSDAASAAARFAAQTKAQAAALWEALTTPVELPAEADDPYGPSYSPPATEPPLTELVDKGGRQTLTGGITDITYFCQSDEMWASQPYGTDTIGPYGCGPTVMAMAVSSLTDTDIDPAAMAAWAVENGYWAPRSGSHYSIVLGTAKSFGLVAEPYALRGADDVLNTLAEGKMIVALVGPGHFTQNGHFLLIRGTAPDGKVLIADPNSLEHSLMPWDPQIILDELSSTRAHGAPMWTLWAPDT